VTPIDDTVVELNDTVIVTLTGSVGVYAAGTPSTATVTIADNDAPPGPSLTASPSSVVPGGTVTASWSGISNPTAKDWIGLYTPGAGDGSYQSWLYVSCSQTPGIGSVSGACVYGLPDTHGTYELRFFANDGFARLATSNPVTVQ